MNIKKIITDSRKLSQNPYAHLDGDGNFEAILINLSDIRNPQILGKRISFEDIEDIVKSFQNALWKNRHLILEDERSEDLLALLDPKVAFEVIGYEFGEVDTLPQFMTNEGMVDGAGFMNRSQKLAGVSSKFPMEVQNFTAAHELGHAILHNATGMHRDRALNGEAVSGSRDRTEIEADKFATYWTMPEKVVRVEFQKRFLSEKFVISEDTAFGLFSDSQEALRKKCTSLRQLARELANARKYNERFFESLAKKFKVSTEAMAIRLDELNLVEY